MALLPGLLAKWSWFWRALFERCGRIILPFQPLILALIHSFGRQTKDIVYLNENVGCSSAHQDLTLGPITDWPAGRTVSENKDDLHLSGP